MSEPEHDALLATSLVGAEAAMHKGRAKSLIVVAGLGIAIAGALVALVSSNDQSRVYGEIGRRINGLARQRFDQFWACALPTENVSDIASNAELSEKIDARGEQYGRPYGSHLMQECLPKLEKVGPELETLIVPQDLKSDVAALAEANTQLRSSVSNYAAYLGDPASEYDSEQAKPHLTRIARAWYEFKKAHAAVNAKIKDKLK